MEKSVWRMPIMLLECTELSVIFLMMCSFSYKHLILPADMCKESSPH